MEGLNMFLDRFGELRDKLNRVKARFCDVLFLNFQILVNIHCCMMKPIIALILLSILCGQGNAAVLARYDFTGQAGNQASTPVSTTALHISASAITRSTGIVAQAAADSINSSDWTTSFSIDLTDYYQLTLTPEAGYAFTFSTFSYRSISSSLTGPRSMAIRTSLDNYASNMDYGSLSQGVTQDISANYLYYVFPGITTTNQTNSVTFRIYGYYSSNTSGTWQLKNHATAGGLVFDGTVGVVDVSPPATIAAVNDGPGPDISVTISTTQLSANWAASSDAESGIAKYLYAIGTSPGATDVAGWTSNGLVTFITRAGLSLTNGQTYYFTVKAENGFGLQSVATNSNGQTVNTSAMITSVQSGSWFSTSTWDSGMIPTVVNPVTIAAGHTVTLNTLFAVSSGTVINGTLKASRVANSSWTLVGGDINVNPGGTLDYGTEADVIPSTIIAHLVLSSGTYAGQFGLIVNNGGNFTVRGSTKTPYAFASASIGASDTSLTVYGSTSVAGWQAGDVITIGPTSGNGVITTSSRTIISVAGGNPYTINWLGGALGTARTLTAGTPIMVGNLTRNVLVCSLGTNVNSNSAYIQNLAQNATSFVLAHGEFANLGANVAEKYGITFNGALTRGSILNSTIRNGYVGMHLIGSSNNSLTGNNLYSNSSMYGGIYLKNTSNNILTGNNSYSNLGPGIILNESPNNILTGNNVYSNFFQGIYFYSSSDINTLIWNNSYSNSNRGIYLLNSSDNILIGNNFYSNSSQGIGLNGSSNNTLTRNNLYSNYLGIYVFDSSDNTFIDGNIGYNSAGDSLKNDTAEIGFLPGTPATPETLILKNARINPAVGISTAGMDVAGASLISYNQDADTGTVRIWGNYQLAGSTLTLDHAQQLYASANTAPKLMRGTGHSITLVTTNDAATLSELITVRHTGGNSWTVTGSSSGVLGTFTQGVSGYYDFTHSKVYFRLTVGSTLNVDDTLDFVTMAASKDANVQKKLLFGPAASTFNNGRSKLEVDSTGGIVLRGKTDGTANTLIDWLGAGSTYYTFVDSGALTAAYSSFTNMDQSGIQLSGNKGVAISSSTFDYLGFASGANTYITARSLTSNATFYNVAFNLSRSSAGYSSAYNVRVEGTDSALNWNFPGAPAGALWGEAYDHDPNNKVAWNGNSGAYVDCGYRIFDGTAILTIACEPPGAVTSPLRIAKNGQIYGIELVPVDDINASKQRIKTSSGVKALASIKSAFCTVNGDKNTHTTINGDVVYCDNSLRMWTPTANIGGTLKAWGPTQDEPSDSCVGLGAAYPACNYCDTLTYAGLTGWKLPDKDVLTSFWTTPCGGASCGPGNAGVSWDTKAQASYYWSSSEHVPSTTNAWLVDFLNGAMYSYGKPNYFYARCVRAGS